MCVARVPSLALQSEYFLHTWHNGAGLLTDTVYLIIYHCEKLLFLSGL